MSTKSQAIKYRFPEDFKAEHVDGRPIYKAEPGGEHGGIGFDVGLEIGKRFRGKARNDGTGGWWFADETTLFYPSAEKKWIHDIVGWRRDRVPIRPIGFPVQERPDWVCEISHSTLKKDTLEILPVLATAGVPHYWVLDVLNENLRVFELVDGQLHEILSLFKDDGLRRIPPFEAAEIFVGALFGEDIDL